MLTKEELDKGYINVDKGSNPLQSHTTAVNALYKIQEFLYETYSDLTADEAIDAINDYVDGMIGKYNKKELVCKTDSESPELK